MVIVGLLDFRHLIECFTYLVKWVKSEPTTAAFAIILVYSLLVVLTLPVAFVTVPLGLAFNKAFDNYLGKLLPCFILYS